MIRPFSTADRATPHGNCTCLDHLKCHRRGHLHCNPRKRRLRTSPIGEPTPRFVTYGSRHITVQFTRLHAWHRQFVRSSHYGWGQFLQDIVESTWAQDRTPAECHRQQIVITTSLVSFLDQRLLLCPHPMPCHNCFSSALATKSTSTRKKEIVAKRLKACICAESFVLFEDYKTILANLATE